MAINIPLRDVAGAQHLRCLVRGPVKPDNPTNIVDLVMDVYTGWLTFTYEQDDPANDHVFSFVPLGTGTSTNLDIQSYVGGASAIVSASISSFADDPDLAAVDRATVKLVTKNFAGLLPAQVLVLDASIAVGEGKLHRIAYQVTVLVTAKEPPRALAELNDTRLSIDRATTP
jgi:hypothetical protein